MKGCVATTLVWILKKSIFFFSIAIDQFGGWGLAMVMWAPPEKRKPSLWNMFLERSLSSMTWAKGRRPHWAIRLDMYITARLA